MFKPVFLLSVAGVALSACSMTSTVAAPAPTVVAPVAVVAPPAPKPDIGTWGFDVEGMDRSVLPGDDWGQFANGTYLKTLEIPADRASYGMFTKLRDLSQARTREIIEAAAASGGAPGSEAQKVGDYYASFMDEAAIEALGAAPLLADLAKVTAIKTKSQLARAFAEEFKVNGPTPFNGFINQDAKDPDVYIPYLLQDGLGLPDRDYYLVDKPSFVDARAKYVSHIAKMLVLAGTSEADAAAKAKSIYDLEKRIAQVHWNRVDSRDSDKTYNKWMLSEFGKKAPGFDWKAFFDQAGIGTQAAMIVAQPSAFKGIAGLVASQPLAVWKDWLTYQTISDRAPLLPKAFVDQNFAFKGTVLNGTPQLQPRWKRGSDAVTGALGEALGQLYVAKYFPTEAKSQADDLVKNIIAAMDDRLSKLDWMADETKVKAKAKLAAFTPKIGYPATWRDYSALNIVKGDAYGNAKRAIQFEYNRNIAKLGAPIDRGEWFMTPMTVNAYANPGLNEIVFPAAILQAPFFDPKADPAVNYGGIGAVIGHEIIHHFDDQGRKYDATGKLTEWWTPEDVKRFTALTDKVVAQYAEYEPLPGTKVNGGLTLGENMADLAGVTIALDAYRKSLGGKEAPVIDGMTGEQRFFLGFSQVWRQKYRDASLQAQLATDPHTPGHFRPYVVRNLDAWYTAWGAAAGQKLYLTPEQRIRVW